MKEKSPHLRLILMVIAFLALTSQTSASSAQPYEAVGNTPKVAVIIDPALLPDIREGADQFKADLLKDGYIVVERVNDFADPTELRTYLREFYESKENLVGAFFIGNIPHSYQWIIMTSSNPDIPPTEKEAISFQYNANCLKSKAELPLMVTWLF